MRGVALAAVLCVLAFALHAATPLAWTMAGLLAATLGALAWRGGAWRRGAFAGVLAGLPPMICSSIVMALSAQHCTSCEPATMWQCTLACLGTSALVGGLVGYAADGDRKFAIASLLTASLTGLLGCATMGLGGAVGVVIGLVAGGATGWVAARPRTA